MGEKHKTYDECKSSISYRRFNININYSVNQEEIILNVSVSSLSPYKDLEIKSRENFEIVPKK